VKNVRYAQIVANYLKGISARAPRMSFTKNFLNALSTFIAPFQGSMRKAESTRTMIFPLPSALICLHAAFFDIVMLSFRIGLGAPQSTSSVTNFEDDFGKYASPYLISHLTSTAL
jgi:hypothetical protein